MKKIAFAALLVATTGAFAADGDLTARFQADVSAYNVVKASSGALTGTAYVKVSDVGDFEIHNFGTSNSGSSPYVVGYYTYTTQGVQSLAENTMLAYAKNSYANGQYQAGGMATTTIDPTSANTAEEYKANTDSVEHPEPNTNVYATDYTGTTTSADQKIGFYLRHDDGTYQVMSHFELNEEGLLTLYFDATQTTTTVRSGWGWSRVTTTYAEQFIVFGEVAETRTAGTPLPGFLPTLLLGSLGLGGFSLRRFRKQA